MKIKYFIDISDYPVAKSDLDSIGFDCIDLLLSADLSSEDHLKKFIKGMKSDGCFWWGDATKVEKEGNIIKIMPAFDDESYAELPFETVSEIIRDWGKFIKNKQPFEKAYMKNIVM